MYISIYLYIIKLYIIKDYKAKPGAKANKTGRCSHRYAQFKLMNEATQSITQHVHATPQIFVCIFKMLYDAISTQAPHVIPDAVHLPQWAVATEQSASSGFKTKAGGCSPTRTLHFEGKQGEHFVLDQFGSTFPNAQVVMATGCKRKNKMEATNPNVFTFLDYECKPLQ